MTSAEATGQEYYYGNRQIDNSPRGFGYHRGRGQPTLLQPVTDRTYRDVTNRDSDVEWHHHRGGPQRPAGSVDVFVPQKRSDVATVSRDWTPIVRGQSSPDDEGRSYRNHYGYYGSTTDADTQRQPLNDDRLEIAVANGSQTTIRGVEANVFLQLWAAGEGNERYPATVRTPPNHTGNAGDRTLTRRAPNLHYPSFEIDDRRFGVNNNCCYPRVNVDVGEKNSDNRPDPEESRGDSHTQDWQAANDNRSRIVETAGQVVLRPNRGNEIHLSPRYQNAAAATAVGDKNETDNRPHRERVYLEKFAAVTVTATRQTDNDGETGKPRAIGVERDFDDNYRRRGRYRFVNDADDGKDFGRTVAAAGRLRNETGNDRRHLDGRAPPEKIKPHDSHREPSTTLVTDPTTAVPEPFDDVTASRQRRRKIQSSTFQSPTRPLVTDIRTKDDGGGGKNDHGRKRDNHNGHGVHYRHHVTTSSGNEHGTTATAGRSTEEKEWGQVVAGDEPQQEQERGYGFGYAVIDEREGTAFDQWEHRKSGRSGTVTGQYRVRLPDGRRQKVVYSADADTGYKASVTYEGVQRFPPQPSPRSSVQYDPDATDMLSD